MQQRTTCADRRTRGRKAVHLKKRPSSETKLRIADLTDDVDSSYSDEPFASTWCGSPTIDINSAQCLDFEMECPFRQLADARDSPSPSFASLSPSPYDGAGCEDVGLSLDPLEHRWDSPPIKIPYRSSFGASGSARRVSTPTHAAGGVHKWMGRNRKLLKKRRSSFESDCSFTSSSSAPDSASSWGQPGSGREDDGMFLMEM